MQIYDIEQAKDFHQSVAISSFERKPSKAFVGVDLRTVRREKIN